MNGRSKRCAGARHHSQGVYRALYQGVQSRGQCALQCW
jgi:hypothetical protein